MWGAENLALRRGVRLFDPILRSGGFEGRNPQQLSLNRTVCAWSSPSASASPPRWLAEGVYAIIHDDATHEWPSGAVNWPHGNTGVILGTESVLVIDATWSGELTRRGSRSSE